jgi:hypothetical protein
MAQIVLDKLAGVNGTTAELNLESGEPSASQNVRNRPLTNWVKRQGVEPVATSSDPYMGIFDIELDGIIIPIIQTGGTLTFFPNVESATWPNPDPYPPVNPIDDGGNRAVLFLIEPLMRSVQEKTLRVGLTKVTWPNGNINSTTTTNIFFNPDGSLRNGNTGVALTAIPALQQNVASYWPAGSGTADFPTNNIYKYDLAYMDEYLGQPVGTRAKQLINVIRSQIISLLSDNKYIGDPEGQASIPYLDDTAIGLPPIATTSNYRSTLTNMRNAFRLVFRAAVVATFVNSTDTGDAQSREGNNGYVGANCNDAKTNATTTWNGASYGTGGTYTGFGYYEGTAYTGVQYYAELFAMRSKLKVNLTNYTGTSASFYFIAIPGSNGSSNNPPVTADNLFHKADAISTGSTQYSQVYGSGTPAFSGSNNCPLLRPGSTQYGWFVNALAGTSARAHAVFNVTFTNFF